MHILGHKRQSIPSLQDPNVDLAFGQWALLPRSLPSPPAMCSNCPVATISLDCSIGKVRSLHGRVQVRGKVCRKIWNCCDFNVCEQHFFNECACYHFAGICIYIFLCLQKLVNRFENLRSTPGPWQIYICLKFIKFNV
jgi:hypothetical protein